MNRRSLLEAAIAVPVVAALPWDDPIPAGYFRLRAHGVDGRVVLSEPIAMSDDGTVHINGSSWKQPGFPELIRLLEIVT